MLREGPLSMFGNINLSNRGYVTAHRHSQVHFFPQNV